MKKPEKPNKRRYISLEVDRELYRDLQKYAKINQRSLAQSIRLILFNGVYS
jgi:hypothetical protein